MTQSAFHIASIASIPFGENTYVAHLEGRSDCVVVDPGLEPEKIVQYIEGRQLEPSAILCTHGHSDHIGGNAELKHRWPDCPLVIGSGDAPKLTDPQLNLSATFGIPIISPPADILVGDGDLFPTAGIEFEVRETPGHSPGHVIFVWRGVSPIRVFGGDVLFQGSIGRTDFPDGDFKALESAVHNKLFTLPDETIVLPGHGLATTTGEEKQSNPFVGAPAGYGG